ncbi:hypothetical protein Glove_360g56 [Diversispora epigaea]|uniref:Uncharacterized protein n=1 Tax=Diversispora epigaea TaxID=1348612 RepID=A0A397H9X3_9GLOM|nr:hypothetical protein Glove_360g56 [Diversispora epigaea]
MILPKLSTRKNFCETYLIFLKYVFIGKGFNDNIKTERNLPVMRSSEDLFSVSFTIFGKIFFLITPGQSDTSEYTKVKKRHIIYIYLVVKTIF